VGYTAGSPRNAIQPQISPTSQQQKWKGGHGPKTLSPLHATNELDIKNLEKVVRENSEEYLDETDHRQMVHTQDSFGKQ